MLVMSYLEEAQASGSWYRKSRRSHRSWTRFVLQTKIRQSEFYHLALPVAVKSKQIDRKFTFWDLLETLISGSHDCGRTIKNLDRKRCLRPRRMRRLEGEVGW